MGETINTRYSDGEYIKLKDDKHKLLYCFPKDLYLAENYTRFKDIHFKKLCCECDRCYVVDELKGKVIWMGVKDENGDYKRPLTKSQKYNRTPNAKRNNDRARLKHKAVLALDPERAEAEKEKIRIYKKKRYVDKSVVKTSLDKMKENPKYEEYKKKSHDNYRKKKQKENKIKSYKKKYLKRLIKKLKEKKMEVFNEAYNKAMNDGFNSKESIKIGQQAKRLVKRSDITNSDYHKKKN